MIQDISPSRMYNQYQDEKRPEERSIILCMQHFTKANAYTDDVFHFRMSFLQPL